jgi:hypothetical protein
MSNLQVELFLETVCNILEQVNLTAYIQHRVEIEVRNEIEVMTEVEVGV